MSSHRRCFWHHEPCSTSTSRRRHMEIGNLISEAMDLLGRIRENTQSPRERELLLAAAEALRFIDMTGQHYDEEARAWFDSLPERPAQAVIQIGGESHLVAYHRNIDHLAFHPFSIVQRLEERRKS